MIPRLLASATGRSKLLEVGMEKTVWIERVSEGKQSLMLDLFSTRHENGDVE